MDRSADLDQSARFLLGTEAFSPRLNTVRLDGLADDILSDNDQETEQYGSLFTFDASEQPVALSDLGSFSGWLVMNRTHRKWVVISGSHLLWSKREKQIGDDKLKTQRRRFESWMSVLNIGGIKKLKGKQSLSFAVVIAGSTKAYLFKAATVELRDDWVMEIEAHRRHLMSMLDEEQFSKKK